MLVYFMRTTVTIADELYEQALELAEPSLTRADRLREALTTFVPVQAVKRWAALGGRAPDASEATYRREATSQ